MGNGCPEESPKNFGRIALVGDAAHPLLQELARRAPGTYNHSINVASLAEAAAEWLHARMREQAGEIRKTLRLLHRDVELVVTRVAKLDTHFRQAREDLEGIGTAAERAGKRAARLDNFDFEEVEGEDTPLPMVKGPPVS